MTAVTDDLVELIRHGARVLAAFKERCRRNGVHPPAELESLRLALLAWERQDATGFDRPRNGRDADAMTFAVVAEALSVSTRTVQRMVAAGTLPAVAVAGSPRILRSDLNAYLASLRHQSPVRPGDTSPGDSYATAGG